MEDTSRKIKNNKVLAVQKYCLKQVLGIVHHEDACHIVI